jgi:hypothetical protein
MVRAVALLSSRETERVQVFIRQLSLGLDQGTQQHLVSTTFGNPSEARDLTAAATITRSRRSTASMAASDMSVQRTMPLSQRWISANWP